MTVNRLDGNRVLIVLEDSDLSELKIEPELLDFRDSRHRTAILGVTRSACGSKGIETEGKRINIEALQVGESCYLLVTVNGRTGVYRAKRTSGFCCVTESAEELMSLAEKLCKSGLCCEKTAVYTHGGKYCVVFDYPALPAAYMRLLGEYGTLRRGALFRAKITEGWTLVCPRDALRLIAAPLL